MHLIHRGIVNKKYKENLLKSFKQSFKKGYGIETDIHVTKDHEFVCFHDFTLNRIFKKKGSVKNIKYSRIKKISTQNKKPIPLLKELLKISKNKYLLFIEIKPTFSKKMLQKFYSDIFPLREHNPVIEFDLRQGVRFHDGHEFDSGDVLFTYHSIMNPLNASPRTSDYEPLKSAEALGKYKVRFVYKRLFSPAISAWTIGIIPEHLLNKEKLNEEARRRNLMGKKLKNFSLRDSEFNKHPVGSGPFVFREWKGDQFIRLDRNKFYWEGPPEYHHYVMRIIPDPLTQEMEFYAGAVDNYSVQPHQVDRLRSGSKFQSFSSVGYFYSYIGYNLRNPLLADRRVRRALGMAIDVNKIIEHILYGEGERVTGPFPKITDWYDHSVQPVPYDPEGALKTLNDLGWKKNIDGFLEKDGQSLSKLQ